MNELLELMKEYLKPELVVLIPVAYFLGTALKKSKKINDEYIPMLLGLFTIILSAVYVLATSVINSYQDVLMAFFTSVTQGILMAGCSVYVNQIIKQLAKSKEESISTDLPK